MDKKKRYNIDSEEWNRILGSEEYKKLTESYANYLDEIYKEHKTILTNPIFFDTYLSGYIDGAEEYSKKAYCDGVEDGVHQTMDLVCILLPDEYRMQLKKKLDNTDVGGTEHEND